MFIIHTKHVHFHFMSIIYTKHLSLDNQFLVNICYTRLDVFLQAWLSSRILDCNSSGKESRAHTVVCCCLSHCVLNAINWWSVHRPLANYFFHSTQHKSGNIVFYLRYTVIFWHGNVLRLFYFYCDAFRRAGLVVLQLKLKSVNIVSSNS